MFWVPARIFEAAFCCSAFCVLACDVYPINKIATSRYLEEYLKTYMYTESTVVNLQIVRSCPSRLLFSPPKERKSQWNSLKALSLESVTLLSFIFQPGRRPFPYPLQPLFKFFCFFGPMPSDAPRSLTHAFLAKKGKRKAANDAKRVWSGWDQRHLGKDRLKFSSSHAIQWHVKLTMVRTCDRVSCAVSSRSWMCSNFLWRNRNFRSDFL